MSAMNWIDQMIAEGEYPRFKKLYDTAVSEGHEQYMFHGQVVLTAYAKYVVQYVDTMKGVKHDTRRGND